MNFNRSKFLIFLVLFLALIGGVLAYIFFKPSPDANLNPNLNTQYCHVANLPYQNPALSIEERVDDATGKRARSSCETHQAAVYNKSYK